MRLRRYRNRPMKSFCTAVGLAALLMAGSAKADLIVYDTITGQTENIIPSPTQRDSLRPTAFANRGPLGAAFPPPANEEITSVTLRLRNINTTRVGDTGAVLVYLVPSTGTGVS